MRNKTPGQAPAKALLPVAHRLCLGFSEVEAALPCSAIGDFEQKAGGDQRQGRPVVRVERIRGSPPGMGFSALWSDARCPLLGACWMASGGQPQKGAPRTCVSHTQVPSALPFWRARSIAWGSQAPWELLWRKASGWRMARPALNSRFPPRPQRPCLHLLCLWGVCGPTHETLFQGQAQDVELGGAGPNPDPQAPSQRPSPGNLRPPLQAGGPGGPSLGSEAASCLQQHPTSTWPHSPASVRTALRPHALPVCLGTALCLLLARVGPLHCLLL